MAVWGWEVFVASIRNDEICFDRCILDNCDFLPESRTEQAKVTSFHANKMSKSGWSPSGLIQTVAIGEKTENRGSKSLSCFEICVFVDIGEGAL